MHTLKLAGLALLAACAPGVAPTAGLDADGCGPAPHPAVLPAASSLLDSAGAVGVLRAWGGAPGSHRFTVFASPGDAVRLLPIAYGDGPAGADSLAPLFSDLLRPQPNTRVPWAVRIHATTGAAAALEVEPSQYCRAQRLPGTLRMTYRMVRDPRINPRVDETVEWQMVVGTAGDVAELHRIGGNTPNGSPFEYQMRDILMDYQFRPARLDGIPVTFVDTVRNRIRARRE